jgi:hypothetical protein
MNAQTVAGWQNFDSRVFLYLFVKLVSTKLSHKVCIVEAWVEGGCETGVPEGRGGAEVEAWRRQ